MKPRTVLAAAAGVAALAVAASPALASGGEHGHDDAVTLLGRAVLPALTFAPGGPSGSLLGTAPINGVMPPFAGQPVQGVSAVLDAGWGWYWAMPDNGFGAKENSADFLLRVYKVRPDFETRRGGSGTVQVGQIVQLRDPDARIPFALTRADRLLTGSDFDIESVRRDRDGGFWFGDEFGPWLLHTDATGKVLEAPIPLPGVKSPQNQTLGSATANLPRSKGFEGMAISKDGRTLYPMLEGALTTDSDQRRLLINEFDVRSRTYTGRTWQYRLESPANAIGDLTRLDRSRLLVIERDNGQGATALFKKIYELDLRRVGPDGFLVKREVVDLLAIADPNGISLPGRPGDLGLGATFAFPFQTIESVLPLGDERLLVANDNNFPFSAGRNPALPDDNEFIVLGVDDLGGHGARGRDRDDD